MVEFKPTLETKRYQFDKIEKDIIEDFLMVENNKHFFETGTNKYTWHWQTEGMGDGSEFSTLIISQFDFVKETNNIREVQIMKIVPVDKFDRQVQTADQRKKYLDRIKKTQDLQQQLMKSNIKLMSNRAEHEKTPHFAPLSDP